MDSCDKHIAANDSQAARQLRDMCSKKTIKVEAVVAFMDALAPATLLECVQSANGNGKAALHYAAQLRPGEDGAKVCMALLARKAHVDATTRRGHTALLFAAGRGHGESVRALLDAKANTHIIAASGDLPWKCPGAMHLDAMTLELLKAAEEAEERPWQDFSKSEDACAAQVEYEQASLICCAKKAVVHGKSVSSRHEQDPTSHSTVDDMRASYVNRIIETLQGDDVSLLTAAFVTAALKDKLAARTAMRMIFSGDDASSAVCPVLQACRAEGIATEMAKQSSQRLRAVATSRIVCAFLHELRNSKAANDLASQEIIEAAEPDVFLTIEVLLAKDSVQDLDKEAIDHIWCLAIDMARAGDRCFSELAWAIVGKQQVQGRQRQFAKCRDWVLLLRWACGLRPPAACFEMLDDITDLAMSSQGGHEFLEVIADITSSDDVKDYLRSTLSQRNPKWNAVPSPVQHSSQSCMPLYQCRAAPNWIADSAGLKEMQIQLGSMIEAARCSRTILHVGLDTEWGERGGANAPPSVLQVAAHDKAWVLDMLEVGQAAGHLILRLAREPHVGLLGFSFGRDIVRLAELLQQSESNDGDLYGKMLREAVRDLQEIAMSRKEFSSLQGRMPGLQRVAEVFLGQTLDKRLQCSNWDERPLSAAQIQYAATDAAVLLDVALAMGL